MSATTSNPPVSKPRVWTSNEGPWGELEVYETFLEAPASLLSLLSLPSQQPVWNFVGMSRDEVTQILQKAGLDQSAMQKLSNPHCWNVGAAGTRVFPPADLVESIPPATRGQIYAVLAQWEENPMHKRPIIFRQHDLRHSLRASDLPVGLTEIVERMIYTRGNVSLFADLAVLLREVRTAQQERQLLRILTRTPTLVCRLHLSAKSPLKQIADYWTIGNRQPSALPLLQAIVATREVELLDLIHLFPAEARSQLYTFPSMANCLAGRLPDGVWSSLNFFNMTPVPLYVDSIGLTSHVQSLYEPVSPPFIFGDLIFLSGSENRRATHACVHIADDIVYTKNSPDLFSPWVLMRLKDVIGYHVAEKNAMISAWRRKG